MRSDTQIDLDVVKELEWDTRVDASAIDVQTRDGIVTLKGEVDSWAARLAAQEAAHRVAGVLDVANDLAVSLRGWDGRTDAEIAKAVRHALEWDVLVPHDRIRSTVTAGGVTLEGTVECANQRDDAARAVRNLSGVRVVTNRIVVRPSPVEPAKLRATIEQALQRHAVHAGKHVVIDVRDGVVGLTGTVPSRGEHDAIIGAVTGTPGVARVDDHLAIRGVLRRDTVLGP